MSPNAANTEQVTLYNVAAHLPKMAEQQPHMRAVVFPTGRDKEGRVSYSHYTYQQLNQTCDKIAHGLESVGIRRGTKTVLMVKPSLDFFALTFALFKVGAVPVMIDPGMGIKRMLHCLRTTEAEGFVGIPLAQALRVLSPVILPGAFKTIKSVVTVGRRLFWGGATLQNFLDQPWKPYDMATTQPEEMAAILFTTGSTGPAKGVVYTHGIFNAQVEYMRSRFGFGPGDIDLPTFPLFALFAPALGMTAIIPDMDPTKPAEVDPTKIAEAIENQGVTTMFGSPALLNRVGRYGEAHQMSFPSVRRVITAGAPVAHDNLERFRGLIAEEGQIFTPYGATESLPVAAIESREILEDTREQSAQGKGICVGKSLDGVTMRVIKISDDPIPEWSDDLQVDQGKVGEIIVQGPVVTRRYYNLPEATQLAKIQDGDNFWHRMGDVGWLDEQGRMWFYGRKKHRVETADGPMFTVPCEAIFNQHPKVYRSALVGLGNAPNQKPVIIVELEPEHASTNKDQLFAELKELSQKHDHTRSIDLFMTHPSFPVDIRHNAKIFREKLTVWASKQLGSAA
ncbi:MAG: peptide synthase [Deltaproteobacteria bacterium]|nr:MAG: peptide synthase [Deltaproteobacteria bacterium]